MPKKKTKRPKRSRHVVRPPHRPVIGREAIEGFVRELDLNGSITLSDDAARDVLKLALSTYNDAGTSAAELDAELVRIDAELEAAGYEPEKGTAVAIRRLALRAKRAEATVQLLAKKRRPR